MAQWTALVAAAGLALASGCGGDIEGEPLEEDVSPPPKGDGFEPADEGGDDDSDDPRAPVSLTRSSGLPVSDANVNCRYGENGPNADSQHYRVLRTDEVIGGGTAIEAILPIEVAESPEGTQSATLRLHRLTGDIAAGEFEQLGDDVVFDVPDQVLGEVRVPLEIAFEPGENLVVEVAIADGAQERNLRLGHNYEAQTAPTYLASAICGLDLPTDLATLDNPFEPGTTFAEHSWLVTVVAQPLAP